MRTIRDAASLLARVRNSGDILAVLPALGFPGAPAPLDRDSLKALGLGSFVAEASIARGSGALRALVVRVSGDQPVREQARRISERLSRSSPHILWLLLVLRRAGRELALAAWSSDGKRVRTSALVVELEHVVDSDAETLVSLAAVRDSVDVLAHARWVDLLGRDALTRRFYRTLDELVRNMARSMTGSNREDSAELALLHVSRLLFLSFLEAKGWLDGDRGFLMRTFNDCMATGGGYQQRVLMPLFFGTLNTPSSRRAVVSRAFGRVPFLNGGLFARTVMEKENRMARIGDENFGELFGRLLSAYRFTAREDSSSWSEAAIDPEMLGKAFESLMLPRHRQTSGAFYTPQVMVERLTNSALTDAVAAATDLPGEAIDAVLGGQPPGSSAGAKLQRSLATIRILDPACGSGAFLVHALEKLASMLGLTGDSRSRAAIRRSVLTNSIFGVDINPMAVWLCELRLWLSIVIDSEEEDPCSVPPLPNLDHNIRVGDSLKGGGMQAAALLRHPSRPIHDVRARYMRASGGRKRQLGRTLDALERVGALRNVEALLARHSAQRRELLAQERARDLFGERTHRHGSRNVALDMMRQRSRELRDNRRAIQRGGALPFSFASHFPDAAGAAGFDIVVGNPPWVRVERIPANLRTAMRLEYDVFRLASWEHEARKSRNGPGFAPQVDLAALFVERSLALLREGGTLALILPAKLWKSLAGSGVRQLLTRDAAVQELQDWSEAAPSFDAVVYPSVLVARRRREGRDETPDMLASVHTRGGSLCWTNSRAAVAFDPGPGSPWLLIPNEVRAAFDRLSLAAISFGNSRFGTPRLGVKCGFNAAFVVQVQAVQGDVASIRSGDRGGRVEREMLRPLLKGEDVRPWQTSGAGSHIIWTHGCGASPVRSLPPLTARWLGFWRHELSRRSDLRDGVPWWTVFRTDAARCDGWRVVWPDIGREPRAAVLPPGNKLVPLNSCYVTTVGNERDALVLAALLNSPLTAAWLNALAEQARGGYRRYFAWTVSLLPLPSDWEKAAEHLLPLAQRAMQGQRPTARELLDAALLAYGLEHESVAPLLTWNSR